MADNQAMQFARFGSALKKLDPACQRLWLFFFFLLITLFLTGYEHNIQDRAQACEFIGSCHFFKINNIEGSSLTR